MLKAFPAVIGCIGLMASFSSVADNKLNSEKEKASYTIGVQMGMQLSPQKDELDLDKLMLGFKDSFQGKQTQLSMEEMRQVLTSFQQKLQARAQAAQKELADKNAKEGAAFLAENKKKKGVKTLNSGLQYKVLKAGTGESPKETDTVVTHYRGNLIDGKVFDSSYKRGQPATFPVSGVIKGWTEALQKMKVGGKWKLFVPSDLAYGEKGAGGTIGPNAVLIFEIELLEIKKS